MHRAASAFAVRTEDGRDRFDAVAAVAQRPRHVCIRGHYRSRGQVLRMPLICCASRRCRIFATLRSPSSCITQIGAQLRWFVRSARSARPRKLFSCLLVPVQPPLRRARSAFGPLRLLAPPLPRETLNFCYVPDRDRLFLAAWYCDDPNSSPLLNKTDERFLDAGFLRHLEARCPRFVLPKAYNRPFEFPYALSEALRTALGVQLRMFCVRGGAFHNAKTATLMSLCGLPNAIALSGMQSGARTSTATLECAVKHLRSDEEGASEKKRREAKRCGERRGEQAVVACQATGRASREARCLSPKTCNLRRVVLLGDVNGDALALHSESARWRARGGGARHAAHAGVDGGGDRGGGFVNLTNLTPLTIAGIRPFGLADTLENVPQIFRDELQGFFPVAAFSVTLLLLQTLARRIARVYRAPSLSERDALARNALFA
eukprot:IDg1203t1